MTIFHFFILIVANQSAEGNIYQNTESKITIESGCELNHEGEIDDVLYMRIDRLFQKKCKKYTLIINSNGGHEKVSLKVGEIIAEKPVTIRITSHCLSSCAEFLLPSAAEIEFESDPIIGLHGNPMLTEHLLKINKTVGIENCSFEVARGMEKLYTRYNVNASFWKQQKQALQPVRIMINKSQGVCQGTTIQYKYGIWLPNIKQISDFLGENIKLKGGVCADNEKECIEKTKQIIKDKYIVGDKVIE